jgi:hypothetical protein
MSRRPMREKRPSALVGQSTFKERLAFAQGLQSSPLGPGAVQEPTEPEKPPPGERSDAKAEQPSSQAPVVADPAGVADRSADGPSGDLNSGAPSGGAPSGESSAQQASVPAPEGVSVQEAEQTAAEPPVRADPPPPPPPVAALTSAPGDPQPQVPPPLPSRSKQPQIQDTAALPLPPLPRYGGFNCFVLCDT